MDSGYLVVRKSKPLSGSVSLSGAKNAVLVTMMSLLLTRGVSRLRRVPNSSDVHAMIALLRGLGAVVSFDEKAGTLEVDTSSVSKFEISPDLMRATRASVLVMGPLLARYHQARLAFPGGDPIGKRPIDIHLKALRAMGAEITVEGPIIDAKVSAWKPARLILDYPSVGATENILMAAVMASGKTEIVNAAIEPEILDLIAVLRAMGAQIDFDFPATIVIRGVSELKPVDHAVMFDRLEAGTLLVAALATGGELHLPEAPVEAMELFLEKIRDMGHSVTVGPNGVGVTVRACKQPQAVSFKTMPHPGFPTDLQAPMMALLCRAEGTSEIHETVYENRFLHVSELQRMGAKIEVSGHTARITGVERLNGMVVTAPDIRGGAALVIAGLMAEGETIVHGVRHLLRGYESLDEKLRSLGAELEFIGR